MQYISPFKQLGFSSADTELDPLLLNFGVLKKKMLAEFELSRQTSIILPWGEASKNDVLLFFDRIQNEFPFHAQIIRDRHLVTFLESNVLTGTFICNPEYNERAFLNFVAPHFGHSYCQLALGLLDNQNEPNAFFLELSLWVSDEDENDAFLPLKEKLRAFTTEVEEIAELIKEEDGVKPAGIYYQIFGNNTVDVLNAIDSKIFKEEKEGYMNAALRLVRSCKNDNETGFSNEEVVELVLSVLQKLRFNEPYIREIKKLSLLNKKVKLEPMEEKEESGCSSSTGIVIIVFAGIFYLIIKFIVFIVRAIK